MRRGKRVDFLKKLSRGCSISVDKEGVKENVKTVGSLSRKPSKSARSFSDKLDVLRYNRGKKKVVEDVEVDDKARFEKWMSDVAVVIDDKTGMDLDILPDVDWRKEYYNKGIVPAVAVKRALMQAESEDDDIEDDSGSIDESVDDDDYGYIVRDDDSRVSAKNAIASIFNAFSRIRDNEASEEENIEEENIEEDIEDLQVGRQVSNNTDLMLQSVLDAVRKDDIATREYQKKKDLNEGKEDEDVQENLSSNVPMKTESDFLSEMAEAIRRDEAVITAVVAPGSEGECTEASVMGGDYGRWQPVTKALGSHSGDIEKALEVETEDGKTVKYKMSDEGMPQSAEGGSELWYSIEPDSYKYQNYFLGIKHHKGKTKDDESRWDIMFKKGAGIRSAKSVYNKKNIDTSSLSDVIGRLKAKVNNG